MTWLLDGNWHRQDIDYLLAKRALEAGCLFALHSDAHSIGELRFSDYVIAHARIAGVPAERVINCWSDARLEDWMRERRGEGKKGKGPGKGGKRKGMGRVPVTGLWRLPDLWTRERTRPEWDISIELRTGTFLTSLDNVTSVC
jgi:hypothetical protein